MAERRVRVVVAKAGADDHDRGAQVLARSLRDAGVEVVYAGVRQTPEQIVATALQEDADAVAVSVLSGEHLAVLGRVVALLREAGAGDVVVVGGGIIPVADVPALEELGVATVFPPGTAAAAVTRWVREVLATG